jgi:hypothetical protein
MWILFRIAIVLVIFAARYVGPVFRPKAAGSHAGQPWYKKVRKKRGKIVSFRVGMPLKVPFVFRLQRESSSDRWFKKMGLAHEFQTGDATFDEAVYIACDHPALHRVLKENASAREQIESILDGGYSRVSGDGQALWLECSSTEEPGSADLERLAPLRAALSKLNPALRFYRDPYDRRVAAVEAVTWSIFGYAAAGFYPYFFDVQDIYVDSLPLLLPGFGVGIGMLVAVLGVIATFLSGSSRGSRILIESSIALVLAAPVAGMVLLDDVNRGLDRSQSTVETWNVVGKWRISRRSPYVLTLVNAGTARDLRVENAVYSRAEKGSLVRLEIARGWMGFPWYRKIEVAS